MYYCNSRKLKSLYISTIVTPPICLLTKTFGYTLSTFRILHVYSLGFDTEHRITSVRESRKNKKHNLLTRKYA